MIDPKDPIVQFEACLYGCVAHFVPQDCSKRAWDRRWGLNSLEMQTVGYAVWQITSQWHTRLESPSKKLQAHGEFVRVLHRMLKDAEGVHLVAIVKSLAHSLIERESCLDIVKSQRTNKHYYDFGPARTMHNRLHMLRHSSPQLDLLVHDVAAAYMQLHRAESLTVIAAVAE